MRRPGAGVTEQGTASGRQPSGRQRARRDEEAPAMRVYVLHFATLGALSRAFDRVLEDADVASCMIEPEPLRLRFLAPARISDRLVERIYADGGLRWCSRHDIRAPERAAAASI